MGAGAYTGLHSPSLHALEKKVLGVKVCVCVCDLVQHSSVAHLSEDVGQFAMDSEKLFS